MTGEIKTALGLKEAGLISENELESVADVGARYAISLTDYVAGLIERDDENDPIRLQYVPDIRELNILDEERADPIGDHAFSPVEGIVHRYPDRVLLKAVHICPVYCRFCFRREMVGPAGEGTLGGEALERALAYIAEHTEIWEVILTGGDPLILSPRRLASLMDALNRIEHVKIIRFHSRVPVVDPRRVDEDFIAALKTSTKTLYVAVHGNHPREFTPEAKAAIAKLVDAGIVMLSQSVLLKGINNDADILADLMRGFVEMRVKPYYLHHPDLAPGTSHFRLSIAEGRALVEALRARVSGLCMPHYMLDIPGGHGKIPLTQSPAAALSDDQYRIMDRHGAEHIYCDGAL